ncbi:BlaI/MecI/CopY family transcriptional regulator [Virgibacillus pantothenticus]|uniref:BlaI/MecI/CopY family transcriptional regulator n=1 Tax=Virgibacillus pantothenticus TaxID=1473 RepID=UPI002815C01D|nr:BlaI/MecI/CopY family transcriptional regulator [Virgibacillus pantothenticus]MEB5454748.1 BlaI/MecI/CopY family transcriptional regulator [Virgibacillus pantothenticus]MEB5464252.1 BlaI/MecI/CopY family transcriptional regulator [Virgibacillus pantothenticus]MEB5468577.1 BlaI/MecI/CopY family transcriptional regulator [Virgibacillus pantothenticus]
MYKLNDFQSLSETEMKIMKEIWKINRPFKSNELLEVFLVKEGKKWKGQTIATFLSRLEDKGMLTVKREGRSNVYSPRLSFEMYEKKKAQGFLNTMYKGSVKNFLATLYDDDINSEELDEIKKWFDNR